MPKKKGSSKKKNAVKKVPKKIDIDSVEEETMKRVGRTLEILANFLANWDAAAVKPDNMYPQVMKIKKFYDVLEGWQRDALKAKGKEDYDARMRRLREFVLICQTYS